MVGNNIENEQFKQGLLQNLPIAEILGVSVPIILDAWEVRGVRFYRNRATVSSTEIIQQNPERRGDLLDPRNYRKALDIYRSDLDFMGYGSVGEFLMTGYVANMYNLGLSTDKAAIDINLPPTFNSFLRAYREGQFYIGTEVDHRKKREIINQKELAELVGMSEGLMSNINQGRKRVSVSSLYRILEGLKLTKDLREAAFQKYADDRTISHTERAQNKLSIDQLVQLDRLESWRKELYTLDQSLLERYGFSFVEEFLLARFKNSSKLIAAAINSTDAALMEQSPTLLGLNQFDRKVDTLFLDAWVRRGLYRNPASLTKELDNFDTVERNNVGEVVNKRSYGETTMVFLNFVQEHLQAHPEEPIILVKVLRKMKELGLISVTRQRIHEIYCRLESDGVDLPKLKFARIK